jgi:uroporphyrinogen decarboxylase
VKNNEKFIRPPASGKPLADEKLKIKNSVGMNEFERFRATLNHQEHGGIFYCANFTPEVERRLREHFDLGEDVDLRDYFGFYYAQAIQPKPPENSPVPDYSIYYRDRNLPEGSFINQLGVLEIPSGLFHLTGYVSPLRSTDNFREIEDFPYPNVTHHSFDHMRVEVEEAHKRGKVAVTIVGHMYESSWQIRGYEPFLMDMKINPSWCEFILDQFREMNMKIVENAARAGVDYVMFGDDVANQNTLMFSMADWRRFMKSRWAGVFERAKSINPDVKIWYHSDGNIMDIIPELIEIGVDILNPIQPECLDPFEVKRRFGDKIVLDGTIGTQTTLPFGTPEEVKRIVKRNIEGLGYDGALILAPTHVVEPDVPIENIMAYIDAAREYGR